MRIGRAIIVASALWFSTAAIAGQDKTRKTVWDGVFSETQSKRGEGAYAKSCATCHGPDLTGADVAPPLMGVEFTSGWNDLTVGDLFERVRITMPADKPGSLSAQENADIVAFLLSKNSFPAGQADLAPQTEVLKTIKILTQKP